MKTVLLVLIAFVLLGAPSGAATILVYVEEHFVPEGKGGLHPVREGLLDGLFEAGHVFFEPGDEAAPEVDWRTGSSEILSAMALEGGASLLVVVRAETRTTPRDAGKPLVEVALLYHLIDVSGRRDANIASAALDVDNAGRENQTDALGIDREAGTRLASQLGRQIAASGM